MLRIALALFICLPALGCQKHSDTVDPSDEKTPPPRVGADDVQIKAIEAAGNVYMLEGQGGNIGVSVGPDGVLMIDDQFAPLAPKIRAAIAALAGANPNIEYLINTHYHGDHTGGNAEFGEEARIVAHSNVRKRVSTTQEVLGNTVEPLPEVGWPVITYDQAVNIHFNGEEIKLIHLPTGHTDGDSAILFTKSNVLHLGDQFFNGRFPFIDLDHGGDVVGYAANVAKVIEMVPADIKIIPGHGPLASVDDLRAFHQTLVETTEIVRGHIDAGKTLEQIQKAGLPAKYESWGSGFINTDTWLATIHKSLTR
ncbi:MAG: hypothetical protein Tsb0020_35170 [Haliangiales bacterium]